MSFRYPERRTGFERRLPADGTIRSAWLRTLERYRDSPLAVAVVAVAFVALSGADLLLTLRALDAGATELNPLMAALFATSPVAAGAVKMSIAVVVAATMWAGRRYRRILELSLLAVGVMAALLAYHLLVMR